MGPAGSGCAILARMVACAGEVFVGRVRELGELGCTLDAARAGSGATVLVAGEAGIGKTRLVCELARRARAAGHEVMVGRSIDLVGTELPYQPFVDAFRALDRPWQVDGQAPGSQLQVFEGTLALLCERSVSAPVLLVLEDLQWADTSTLDLVVFLAHNLGDRPVLLLGTCRADEATSAERIGRLADGVRRSGSAFVLELGPLEPDELAMLLAAHAERPLPAALTAAIAVRSEGNPFFAEELLAAAGEQSAALPRGLRDLLLQRVARLDPATQGVLRLAAAAGREVGYPLLRAAGELPERDIRDALRRAVEHGVLVAEQETASFRFRHALLAQAIYTTILPGEREELHARLADELTRAGATAAELAPHWAVAGRAAQAVSASVEAASEAEAVFGLAEALAHLERALALWGAVPDAERLLGMDLAELCSRAAEIASQTGAAPRAVELAERAIGLVGDGDPLRAAILHENLGVYLDASGRTDACLTAFERAVELVPLRPPSAQRAKALAALGTGLMLAWRHDKSLAVCVQALALARAVRARGAELRALMVLGTDLAYLGRGDEGLAHLWQAQQLAAQSATPTALLRAYVLLTNALTMLGRPRESARLAESALEAIRPYGIDVTVLVANQIEALLAIGEWDEADSVSAAALRAMTANHPHMPLTLRADLELGRGQFDAARAHLEAARATVRHQPGLATYHGYVAGLALWERRWTDADKAVQDGLERVRFREAAQIGVRLCAHGLRAEAELAALARSRRDADALGERLARVRKLVAVARLAAAEAAAVTPVAACWLAQAEAEAERACGVSAAESWAGVAAAWNQLDNPSLAAYCRWRQAEALVVSGASRAEASDTLRQAHTVALRIGAAPLLRQLELLAQRARLNLTAPHEDLGDARPLLEKNLGLTPREAEVLALVARGHTDREIAAALVISAKTASVHVSHILHKLGAPNRLEAAAIAHRVDPVPVVQSEPEQ